MARQRLAIESVRRLEVRTRVFQRAGYAVFWVLCMAVGFVVVATAVPQKRRVVELEGQLEQANAREQDMLAERESYEIEHRALREEPAFLEIQARDRLNVYREGERVLKFRKAE
ncbi:MAG: hypothetical protein DVB26_06820 [Verrucomicrobia bacterium]|nr:MAG: hypothetical protein DVB26_06820 [Verrucomicrobiota bacterium]